MKKLIKFFACAVILILACMALPSCDELEGAPEGYTSTSDSSLIGSWDGSGEYYFFYSSGKGSYYNGSFSDFKYKTYKSSTDRLLKIGSVQYYYWYDSSGSQLYLRPVDGSYTSNYKKTSVTEDQLRN